MDALVAAMRVDNDYQTILRYYACRSCGAQRYEYCKTSSGRQAFEAHNNRWRRACRDDALPMVWDNMKKAYVWSIRAEEILNHMRMITATFATNTTYTVRTTRSEDMTKPTVEYLLERKRLLEQAIENQLLIEERFGRDEDYENGFIIVAERKFSNSPITYTYVFLKVKNGRWYSTEDKVYTNTTVYTWEQLVDFLGQCERVDYVTALEEL